MPQSMQPAITSSHNSRKLKSRIVTVSSLSERDLREMFLLFSEYYIDVDFNQFKNDLSEKTHVFMFLDKSRCVGFSTIFRKRIEGVRAGYCLYSGDTVLHSDYWGSKILQTTFFRYIVETKLLSPFEPVYWMLISKGYKTYLLMRRNFDSSYPRVDRATPQNLQSAMNAFYQLKFGSCFNPDTGLIRFERPMGAVKGTIADPPSDLKTKDRDVRYFLDKNPGYRNGDELACIAEIRFRDFLSHIPKYFLKPLRRKAKCQR
jgi:hypothetical protein